jgi:FeS assembly SUF system regulator
MLKLTKKADYGLIALKHLAESGGAAASAKEIADAYHLPQEALAKILQRLAKSRLLVSHQGTNGGYVLARSAHQISALDVIQAIDGDVFLTSCSSAKKGCSQEDNCTIREPLRKVNNSIRGLLSRIKISDMRDAAENESDPMDRALETASARAEEPELELVHLGR